MALGKRIAERPSTRQVGTLFRAAREAQGLSQEEVAALTDGYSCPVPRTTISAIERGRYLPNLETLASLSHVLNVDPMEAIERVNLTPALPLDLTGVSADELSKMAEEHYWSGNYRSALAIYDAMLEQLVLDPPKDPDARRRRRAKTEINRATTLRQCSALKASRASAERAIELSRGISDLQAEAYMVLASLLSHEGLFELASDAVDRAVALAQDGSDQLVGQTWSQKGNVLYRAKRYDEARQAFLHARKFALAARDYHNVITIEGSIGACLTHLGQKGRARGRFTQAVELARKYQDPAGEAFWLVELGRIALDRDEHDEADRLARTALRIAKPADRVLTVFRAEWLRHQIVRKRQPGAVDRHRLAYLRKLYQRVKDHRGLNVIREFEANVLGMTNPGRPS